MSEYLWVLCLSLSLPFVLSFWPSLKFYRNTNALLASIALIVVLFGAWDIFATWRGHWSFNPSKVMGMYIVNLPLEEVLFFVVIPFCCIFTWEALTFISRGKKR
ncbi:MAG: lycopene cyclase domain-containing protein [Candidatus Omnitrophica bacterium]|nr:lycopene cyclase domain-containing protein [Candidatus Omnitrophota bacterium]